MPLTPPAEDDQRFGTAKRDDLEFIVLEKLVRID